MSPCENDYHKLYVWLTGISKIPFGINKQLPYLTNPKDISNFLTNAYNDLDKCIYGQINAKTSILQVISKWISN